MLPSTGSTQTCMAVKKDEETSSQGGRPLPPPLYHNHYYKRCRVPQEGAAEMPKGWRDPRRPGLQSLWHPCTVPMVTLMNGITLVDCPLHLCSDRGYTCSREYTVQWEEGMVKQGVVKHQNPQRYQSPEFYAKLLMHVNGPVYSYTVPYHNVVKESHRQDLPNSTNRRHVYNVCTSSVHIQHPSLLVYDTLDIFWF